MGGRPSKPVSTNKKHLTNAEKEQRTNFEQALLSGKKISERKRVRDNKLAHAEYKRVVELLRAIGKDDALYSEQVNRYAELHAEEEQYKDIVAELQAEIEGITALSKTVTDMLNDIAKAPKRAGTSARAELAAAVSEAIKSVNVLLAQRARIFKTLNDADLKIKQKREAKLAIERENCMTVSAALRTIPKDIHKEEEDVLIKLLGDNE